VYTSTVCAASVHCDVTNHKRLWFGQACGFWCIIFTHVDDCAGTGPPGEIASDYVKLLKRFDGRILGEVDKQTFLGLYHERDWGSRTIAVSQSRRLQEFLNTVGHLSLRTVKSPLVPNVVLSQSSEESTREHPFLWTLTLYLHSL
jgi:hypothetical protein